MAPTKEQLEAQLTGMVMTRSNAKDQIEALDKQMPVINGMLQLLAAQAEDQKELDEAVDKAIKD